ncbi:MAG: transcriptional regulator swi6 [Watsoniomyces obsoletus]|nr:MAG: transcriptional regulator swi6 [Watsoniomyces obsoletus]
MSFSQSFQTASFSSQPPRQPSRQGPNLPNHVNSSFMSVEPTGDAMSVCRVTYSSIQVLEIEVTPMDGGKPMDVMRRAADGWLNATQILKVAGVDKARRVKILDKLITEAGAEVEKVQGGYGRYQGTWIAFERGVRFAREYGVEDRLRPLLLINPALAAELPTKEQRTAARRQRGYAPAGALNQAASSRTASAGTFATRISSAALNAVTAINRAGQAQTASQQSTQTVASEAGPQHDPFIDSTYGTQPAYRARGMLTHPHAPDDQMEPPRKRARRSPGVGTDGFAPSQETVFLDAQDGGPGTPTEPNHSFVYEDPPTPLDAIDPALRPTTGLPPLPAPRTAEERADLALLQGVFVADGNSDAMLDDVFQRLKGAELDRPIDHKGNTALHWAASLGRIGLVHALVRHGASILRVNYDGETALMRACAATNGADDDTFRGILEVVGPTIPVRDRHGRTILHKIALSSGIHGRQASTKHYLETLLGYVIRQPSVSASVSHHEPSFTNNHNGIDGSFNQTLRPTSLGRFMSEIVNAEDHAGDTALNIAARLGSKNIVDQLLEIGADVHMANRTGLKPAEFGVHEGGSADAVTPKRNPHNLAQEVRERCAPVLTALREATDELQEEIFDEIRQRCGELERHRTKLRELTAQLCSEREQHEILHKRVTERKARREKIARLQRACAEIRARRAISNSNSNITNGMVNGRLSPTLDHGINGNYDHYSNSHHHHGYRNSNSSNILGGSHHLTSPLQPMNKRDVVVLLREHNAQLEQRLKELRDRAMESTYRRIISLCTQQYDNDNDNNDEDGTRSSTGAGNHENDLMEHGGDHNHHGHTDDEDDDDDKDEQEIDMLRTAVESEGTSAEVEITRVRNFLRKIREPEL